MGNIFRKIFTVQDDSIITDAYINYAALPTPLASHVGKLYFVQNGSQGLMSGLGIYKYPKGLYSTDGINPYELVPFNVKVAEDSMTLVSITDWTEWIAYSFDIGVGDRLIYNDIEYKNITGTQTSTSPSSDATNWIRTAFKNVVIKINDYTALKDDYTIIVNAASNTVTISLPTAAECKGILYNIKCIDSTFTVTVDADTTETIDGELTQVISQWENLQIQSDGSNWIII